MKKINVKTVDMIRGFIISGIFIGLSFYSFSLFESIEKVLYGIEMRMAISPGLQENKIAIVNIDEKSMKQLGPWPWPRHLIAEMITILKENGAQLIGLDIIFNNNEQNQGLQEIRELYQALIQEKAISEEKDDWLLEKIRGAEERLDNDSILTRAVKESNSTILPVIGSFGKYDSELLLTPDSILSQNRIEPTGIRSNIDNFAHVNELTTPFEQLLESSHGLGHINLSHDESLKGRIHLLFLNYRGHLIPSMPFRLALEYLLGEQSEDLIIQDDGLLLADNYIPTTNGEMLIKFKGAGRSFPYYSFVDILNVKKVPAVFREKIVLIGFTGKEGTSVNTPVDMAMPHVEFTANVIEALMSGRYLKRPNGTVFIEAIILLILIMFSSHFMPHATAINRLSLAGIFIILVIFTGIISFVVLDIWFKTVYICLALITLMIEISVTDLIVSQRNIKLSSKEIAESNRMLGLSFQSQGLYDLAFEKFRRCPLDESMKDVIYNLGLDYERKRMINKAIAVYEYISENDSDFRGLDQRLPKLKKAIALAPRKPGEAKKEDNIVVIDGIETKPTVGRYEIIKELAHGAMGVVYKANDPQLNRLVAIKTIRFSDEFEQNHVEGIKERFFQEAKIAGKLSHRSIVAVYDAGEDHELTYLAMEFINGKDLRAYCKKESLLPVKKVLYIVSEIAFALEYAHTHNVIHRDIKPANIMLLNDGVVKVTDFGIAKAILESTHNQTKSGVILGTPNYMSPEQVTGKKITGQSDVFSLGIVMFELLTGQLPFKGDTITSLIYNITQGRHPSVRKINSKIPKICEMVIDKTLAKSPDKRFQNAAHMARSLKSILTKIDKLQPKR